MAKRSFTLFVFLSIAIIILGLFLLLSDKKVFVPGFVNDTRENWFWNGWGIMIVGLGMLFWGILFKWISSREQSSSQGTADSPPTEFFDNTIGKSHAPDKNTYNI
jgi:uncharacterized membrane protein